MRDLKKDEVIIKYGCYGESIEEIEMLLLPKAKLILSMNEDSKVNFTTTDTDFDNKNLTGVLSRSTVDVLIKQLIRMRNQMPIEEEI